MRVLALDTTTRGGSVALVEDDRVLAERAGDGARSHAERLPADLTDLLDNAAMPLSAIDLFACAAGPGSFTGLRIGIATMQGLAFVSARPIVAVSALEALGQMAAVDLAPGAVVAAWMDAYRREVFSALYRVTDAAPFTPERLVELDPAASTDPAATLSRWAAYGALTAVIGDGAVAYKHLLAESTRVIEPPPIAAAIGRMAIVHARRGLTIDPAAVQPLYVRRPDAEVERDRKNSRHEGHATEHAVPVRGPSGDR